MRRADREITDISAIDDFLSRERILRVAFHDAGDIYIVPVNYGYVRNGDSCTFCFHGACAGRKYELAKSSPTVGFEADGGFRLLESEKACGYSACYMSVIGTGRLTLIEGEAEKRAALDCLMEHQTGRSGWEYSPEQLAQTAVFCIKVYKVTCKAKQEVKICTT
ncbi:MAG: pyridoxamine 5'-phosphate oxidase family protein [Ruminococcus sp.]|nr:pyridoxamine 5'-phosphate oxidase family protein [Ruminococcus sp.]